MIFILMNPLFHVGRADAAGLGQAFIQAAARARETARVAVTNGFCQPPNWPYEPTVFSLLQNNMKSFEDSGGYKG